MVQQVTITTHANVSLKPLVKAALDREARLLTLGLDRTRERLASFEQRFSMTSAEFEKRLQSREIEETLDFIDWRGEIKTLRLLEEQERALRELQIH